MSLGVAGSLETRGLTAWRQGWESCCLLIRWPVSLEEVIVSETAQMFWGKLEKPWHWERWLHQNLDIGQKCKWADAVCPMFLGKDGVGVSASPAAAAMRYTGQHGLPGRVVWRP